MSNHGSDLALEAAGVSKGYRQGDTQLSVLNGLSLQVAAGERIAILGPSGSGKSTLLHCLAGLDEPDAGAVSVAGHHEDRAPARRGVSEAARQCDVLEGDIREGAGGVQDSGQIGGVDRVAVAVDDERRAVCGIQETRAIQ